MYGTKRDFFQKGKGGATNLTTKIILKYLTQHNICWMKPQYDHSTDIFFHDVLFADQYFAKYHLTTSGSEIFKMPRGQD